MAAAKHFYRQGFLLLLFNFISTAALEKRFSDFKRCADTECSMLLCRGKAVTDFKGPDCRFLSFKKAETIYVYYKLSGRRADMWAGSVGSSFGYFPNDLLAVNHRYTNEEIEIPAEETDFVCFDTGFDKFDNYDIDSLLGSLEEESDGENKETLVQIPVADDTPNGTQPSEQEGTDGETQNDDRSEDLDEVLPELVVVTEMPSAEAVGSDTAAAPDVIESAEEAEQKNPEESVVENEKSKTKDAPTDSEGEFEPKDDFASEKEPVTNSEGAQVPYLKTTFGTTFDAVTTDEEITKRVTPYEAEEESEAVENKPEDEVDVIKYTPLLSFSGEPVDSPTSDSLQKHEAPPVTPEEEPQAEAEEEKNMWTSIGDAVFSVVTGGQSTSQDFGSEEEDDDDDEEEEMEHSPKISRDIEEVKKNLDEPLTIESTKEPENTEQVVQDTPDSDSVGPLSDGDSVGPLSDGDSVGPLSDGDSVGPLLDGDSVGPLSDSDDKIEGEVVRHEEPRDDDVPQIHHQTEPSAITEALVPEKDSPASEQAEKSDVLTTEEEHRVHKEEEDMGDMFTVSDVSDDIGNSSMEMEHRQDLDNVLEDNKTETDHVLSNESEINQGNSTGEDHSQDLDVLQDTKTVNDSLPDQMHDSLMIDSEKNNIQPDLSVMEPDVHEEPRPEEKEEEKHSEPKEDHMLEKEELLEDENALLVSQPGDTETETTESTPEPEYSDSVLRLTLLRDHFTEEGMGRVQRLLGLQNLFKVEAMFSDLDTELQATRLSQAGTTQEIESALEGILEDSENTILDEIEKMLDAHNKKPDFDQQVDASSLDEETQILDDFQELAFRLRQKYSTVSDSTPLAGEKNPDINKDDHEIIVVEEMPHIAEEEDAVVPEAESEDNITVTDQETTPAETDDEQIVVDEVKSTADIGVEEDGGHNQNKGNQPGLSTSDEMQKDPLSTLENPVDPGLSVEEERSGSLESLDSDIHEVEEGLMSTEFLHMSCILSTIKNKLTEWTILMISLLPEEWKPGETLYGCPWQAVVVTAFVGVMTFTLFFWKTVLAVKRKEYLVDEKRFTEQMQALKREKDEALTRMSELQKQTEKLKEGQKQSKETVSGTMKKLQSLESKVLEAESRNEQMAEERKTYAKLLEEERAGSTQYNTRIEKLEKSNEKLQLSRKKIQDVLAKTTLLLDEAKIREDARNVQHKCLDKDYTALKEENKTLKTTIKGWEDKHKELSEQIKSFQKSQKELEDSLALKDHNVEVLSDLLADLDACDLQKGDTKLLPNGDLESNKKMAIENRIKQMMDVSRVQTTLTVVEEERDRFMAKLLNEEKSRKEMEEQHQELEHAIATLKRDKSHVENQFKILQQKNEIMVEMYQQKENALQQRLTKEELERRSKESMLSEVGGKAVEAEEQVKVLRQRIHEMEEQMKKTEEVYKEQIKEQENKTHSNWVNARNSERALNQEKLESSKLREKLAVLSSQLNERRAPLFRPNSGQHAGPRQGDSYGPSPVSGGAPSPPLMIEGPRRPPSAPVGRRIDPYGPRPPSDPHGRYAESKHISAMELMGPRSSSPANMDLSTQAVVPQIIAEAEASTESPEPGPGSFLASPIRDSPGPMVHGPPHGPPHGPGPHDPLLPPGPHGRLPPPGAYRPPRPGTYHLPPGPPLPNLPPPVHGPPHPANGHPGMPLPGPMGGELGPRPSNGHAFPRMPGPGHFDPRGPLPPHFRPPMPPHFGPMHPPNGFRGPIGPRQPFPSDMRYPGPRDHVNPPGDLPQGAPAHPGEAYGQAPPHALHTSAGAHSGPGQKDASQDSARPATVKP